MRTRNKMIPAAIAAMAALLAGPAVLAQRPAAGAAAAILSSPLREAYFGDLHLHTSYSFDAFILFGAKVDPNGAYQFGRGDPVQYLGESVHRTSPPLDFLAVTDHSENIGVFNTLEDPHSELAQTEIGKDALTNGPKAFARIVGLQLRGIPVPGLNSEKTQAISASAWQRVIDAANQNYRPGKFTTFIAYEWTAMPDGQNLHRNVIFKGDSAPKPFTATDSPRPEDLWNYLDTIRKQGFEALAIPHNSNASNGLMFDWIDSKGRAIDQAYAEQRALDEPLVEISQNKGNSETRDVLSPSDEFANFEFYDHLLLSKAAKSKPGGSYVRDAIGRGLEIAARAGGANPYKLGFVGASDFHNGLSDSAENAFVGTFGAIDPTKALPDLEAYAARFGELSKGIEALRPGAAGPSLAASLSENGSGNLTGVWAEQNTRESIYAALRRKETFATSGTRLKFRLFGGWEYTKALVHEPNWVQEAYRNGVAMGGDLTPRPKAAKGRKAAKAAGPRFLVWALKDPEGANLDRAQIVKVAVRDGKYFEKIYDVVLSNGRKADPNTGKAPAVGNTVDVASATYKNTIGATEFATVWQDPDFDPKNRAAYYLRVLEIPTPRWTTILAARTHTELPSDVPATIQERGWSSPIWYTP